MAVLYDWHITMNVYVNVQGTWHFLVKASALCLLDVYPFRAGAWRKAPLKTCKQSTGELLLLTCVHITTNALLCLNEDSRVNGLWRDESEDYSLPQEYSDVIIAQML